MNEAQKDSDRALKAALTICDGRIPHPQYGAVMVTLEHTVATLLLAAMNGDGRKAAAMLNEGLVPRVEERLMLHASRAAS